MRIFAFDSGMGGLSVLGPLIKNWPSLEIHYLGDIANLPYGTKSAERVRALTIKNLRWLISSQGLAATASDLCLIACNTASAEALQESIAEFGNTLPVVGVIEASCEMAIAQKTSSISVLATVATVRSGAYERSLRALGFAGDISQIACPLFVPFVEERILEGPAIEWVVDHYLEQRIRPSETVILGCTHYPFLLPLLQRKFPNTKFIQAGEALAQKSEIFARASTTTPGSASQLKIIVTDSNASRAQISVFLEQLGLSNVNWTLEARSAI